MNLYGVESYGGAAWWWLDFYKVCQNVRWKVWKKTQTFRGCSLSGLKQLKKVMIMACLVAMECSD